MDHQFHLSKITSGYEGSHLGGDSSRGQNRTLTLLSTLWPPVFAGEQAVGQEFGLDRQAGVVPQSDCFADMGSVAEPCTSTFTRIRCTQRTPLSPWIAWRGCWSRQLEQGVDESGLEDSVIGGRVPVRRVLLIPVVVRTGWVT